MRVTVQYVAQIRRLVGCAEESVEFAGGSLADLLRALAERHPEAVSLLLDAQGHPSRSLLFFVNDAPVDPGALLPNEANLTILAPMAGG